MIKITKPGALSGATGGQRSADRSPEVIGQGIRQFAQSAQQAQAASERIQRNTSQAYVAREESRIALDMEQRLQELSLGIDGADPGAFTATVAEEMAAKFETELAAAPSLARGQLGNRMRRLAARVESQAMAIEAKAAIEHINQSMTEGAHLDANRLLSDPDLHEELITQRLDDIAGLEQNEQFKDELAYSTRRTLAYGSLSGRIMQPTMQDEEGNWLNGPERALHELLETQKWDDQLSDDEKRTLVNAARREISSRAAAAEAQDKANVKFLRDKIGDWIKGSLVDRPDAYLADTQQLFAALEVVDDPVLKSDVSEMLEMQSAVQGFRTMGLAAMQQRRDEFLTQINASGTPTEMQQRVLGGMNSMISEMEEMGRRDPVGGAIAGGVLRDRAPLPFNPETGEAPTAQQWEAAYQQALVAADYYGMDSVGLLSPNQAQAMGRMLRNLPPDAAANTLREMSTALPDQYVKAVASQLWDANEEAMATAVALSREAPGVTEEIIRGQRIVDSDQWALSERKVQASIPEDYYALFDQAPGLYDALVPAAKAIYAANAQAIDLQSDSDIPLDAMRDALDQVSGGLVQMNNSKTIAPRRGMTQQDMDALTQRFVIDQFSADGFTFTRYGRQADASGRLSSLGDAGIPGGEGGILTPQKFRQFATLRPHSDGVYYVMIGGRPVVGANQQPFLLDVGKMADDFFAQPGAQRPSPNVDIDQLTSASGLAF